MTRIRQPAVAGTFYPGDASALERAVDTYLAGAEASGPPPKALIAPHAGYVYSAPVAASAYVRLRPLAGQVRRVVLLGPSHRVPFRGVALTSAEAYRTPLGDVPVDREALASLEGLAQVGFLDEAHTWEHSLEVHLPFLQRVLGEFSLVPIVVGDADAETVAAVLDRLWGGPETLIVVSSDLSHYHDYATAREMDGRTSALIAELATTELRGDQACGCRPINGLIQAVKDRGLKGEVIDLRSSGDTAGPKDRVVGYGAYVFA
jgi:hypothetical protein